MGLNLSRWNINLTTDSSGDGEDTVSNELRGSYIARIDIETNDLDSTAVLEIVDEVSGSTYFKAERFEGIQFFQPRMLIVDQNNQVIPDAWTPISTKNRVKVVISEGGASNSFVAQVITSENNPDTGS